MKNTVKDSTYSWINALNGMAYAFAVEYLSYWCEGGQAPVVQFYVDQAAETAWPCTFQGLVNIANRIRLEVR